MEIRRKEWKQTTAVIRAASPDTVVLCEEDCWPIEVVAYVHEDYPGLAATWLPERPDDIVVWTITHLQSGRMLGRWWACLGAAIMAIADYCGGIDWTAPYEVVREQPLAVDACNRLWQEATEHPGGCEAICRICPIRDRPPGCSIDRRGGGPAGEDRAGGSPGAGGAP